MAARLITKTSRVTAYLPNMNAAIKHFRTFSSYTGREHHVSYCSDESHEETVWPTELGPFGPKDRRVPFPGLVGLNMQSGSKKEEPVDVDSLFDEFPDERRHEITRQFENMIEEEYLPEPSPSDKLECVAQECPILLRKDFQELFPLKDLIRPNSDFTIITISHKTENDMSGWSLEVDEEREELLKAFVEGAKAICNELKKGGYWADFIDPSCGKPHLSEHTNATMFETDERYRKLGIEIDDLGCCKVIRHPVWGTHSYVGCLVTDAPLDHPIISAMKVKK